MTDRIAGAIFGSACGDALGVAFSGRGPAAHAIVAAYLSDPPPQLPSTSDIGVSMTLARHLAATRGTVDPRLLSQALTDARISPFLSAAVCVTPVGLLPDLSLSRIADLGRQAAGAFPGQPHPLVKEATAMYATAVALAARTTEPPAIDAFLGQLARQAKSPEATRALDWAGTVAGHRLSPTVIAGRFSRDPAGFGDVATTLAIFLSTFDSPPSAIYTAICLGGNITATAAMAGALCGAYAGINALPSPWTRRLTARPGLDMASRCLAGLAVP